MSITLLARPSAAAAAATGPLSAAERSYPKSEVRGRSWEDPCPKGGDQEELPQVQGQGQRPRVPGCNGAGTAEKSYPSPRSGVAAERSYPTPLRPRPRGGGREDRSTRAM